jgi:hypothetical protein
MDSNLVAAKGSYRYALRAANPGWPIGRLVVGHPQVIFAGLSYYQLVMTFVIIVPLIMEFT